MRKLKKTEAEALLMQWFNLDQANAVNWLMLTHAVADKALYNLKHSTWEVVAETEKEQLFVAVELSPPDRCFRRVTTTYWVENKEDIEYMPEDKFEELLNS